MSKSLTFYLLVGFLACLIATVLIAIFDQPSSSAEQTLRGVTILFAGALTGQRLERRANGKE